MTTVDDTQIMEEQTEPKKPSLHVKMCTDYMRFRYMSEKCSKKKGSKPRHHDADDNEKHSLAEVWVSKLFFCVLKFNQNIISDARKKLLKAVARAETYLDPAETSRV